MLHYSNDTAIATAPPVIIDLGIGATRAAWREPGGIAQLDRPADACDETGDVPDAIKETCE